MSGMNRRDLPAGLKALYPDLRILFMSGYTANVIVHQEVPDEEVSFIQKPFSVQNLARQVSPALGERL